MAEQVVTSVVGKVVSSLYVVVKKEISYTWNCTRNVDKYRNVLRDLKDLKDRVQQQIDIARSKGDNLVVGVQEWVEEADIEISKAEVFLEKKANAKKMGFKIGLCGNWGTLHHYGKRASLMVPSLLQHQIRGMTYESGVSIYTPAPGPLDVYQNKNLDDIVTHNSVLRKIIKAIEDESIQIIGIYGIGGVGKTTLAKEVASKMKNQFAAVAITTVSQTVNVEKIKEDIEKETKKMMQGKKILIILDDVWEKLNLEEFGIPYGINQMNCRILLTSRSEDVCKKMNAQSIICLDPLRTEEAWILFKQVVGETVEIDGNLKQVAMKVAEECGGLPLLIQAVGNALKDKSIDSWNLALTRLRKHAPLDIDPDIKKAYKHLKLSYDYLDNEEAKSCFLLCSMFPEDYLISLEDMVYYGVGLAKFNDLESMNDARDRVQNAVNILTSSGLLLKTGENKYTKMHDVVRDVALSIASKGNNKFLVKAGKALTEWLPRNNTLESYTGISLMYNQIRKLPDYELHFPRLNTFLVPVNDLSTISNEFIGGMKEARVVDMSWNRISSLPQSLKLLTKLCMLDLGGNKFLLEISIIGELKDLEILILNGTGIKEIPPEIGQLVNLRRFDVSYCEDLCHITPGVLLKLRWLEELCIGFYSVHEGIYDSLVEVTNLSKLAYLNLLVPSFDVIPECFSYGKLKKFVFQFGVTKNNDHVFPYGSLSKCNLVIATKHLKIPFSNFIKKLIEGSPNTVLDSIENLDNILPTLYHEGFSQLESIRLEQCFNVSCLVDTRDWYELKNFHSSKHHFGDEGKTEEKLFMNLKHLYLSRLTSLEVLWKCPDQYIRLSDLVTLHIEWCSKLVKVFSVSVAQGLVSLQELSIKKSDVIEEVITDGDEGTNDRASETEMAANIIVFPSLAKIIFYDLTNLKSFYSGNSTIKYPSLVKVSIRYCDNMKIWGYGIQDTPKLKFVDDLPILYDDGPHAFNDAVVKSSESWVEKRKQV